jgi:hypothetical protein
MKRWPYILCIVSLIVICVGIALRCEVKTTMLEMGFRNAVPDLTRLANQYTHTFETTGGWPPPGTFTVESSMPYLRSIQLDSGRTDIYGTLSYDYEIYVSLGKDGTLQAEVSRTMEH